MRGARDQMQQEQRRDRNRGRRHVKKWGSAWGKSKPVYRGGSKQAGHTYQITRERRARSCPRP